MKISVIFLRIAGVISLVSMLFHFTFQHLLNWELTLSCLSQGNRSILLTYHYISILTTCFMGLIPLFQTRALLSSSFKYSLLSLFSLFYLIRIITEFTLFGIGKQSPVIISMCVIPMVLFAYPIFVKTK
jgi:hypothetical protein